MDISQATLDFISRHADDDPRQLALQGSRDPQVDTAFALQQIAGRQTARQKLPSWAATDGLVYPPHLSLEQCSSEQTARYKARLITQRNSAQPLPSNSPPLQGAGWPKGRGGVKGQGWGLYSTFADLTGGLGVDFSFMAPHFAKAYYVERQPTLCGIARHNLPLLGLPTAQVVSADGVEFLQQSQQHFNWVFIDPARRDAHGSRTYGISDCTPDVLSMLSLLREKADHVLLKLSPMLDWCKAVSDIGPNLVSEVHIVSVANECKELLVVVECGGLNVEGESFVECGVLNVEGDYSIHCVNLLPDGEQHFEYNPSQHISFNTPHSTFNESPYLYEPNASIMKAGCFNELAAHFGVSQVAPNSHLFTSDRLVPDFPGRQFVIEAVTTMNKRELRQYLQGITQANIAVRNFPLTAADLRRRLKLADGGPTYIFATTLADHTHVLLVCRKAVFV